MRRLPQSLLARYCHGTRPMGRLCMGKLPRYPLVTCCIIVLLLCLRKETPCEENSVGRLSSRCGTLAYIALSHFSNVRHSSRQCYLSLSLEHTRRLWWSSTLECSISFSYGNCPFNRHSRSCHVRGFTGCILLGDAASRYNINVWLHLSIITQPMKESMDLHVKVLNFIF